MKKRGFTLIELLVVIAIIAILAAILFPVFARARENARRSSCQSNLKQIALGVFQYTQDYDEKFPHLYTTTDNGGWTLPDDAAGDQGWALLLQPYLKSAQIFQCPSETNTPTADAVAYGGAGYTDYWYNNQLANQSQASVEAVAQTVMNGDGSGTNGAGALYYYNGVAPNQDDDGEAAAVITGLGAGHVRHLDGGNFAFADGHVKWLKGNPAADADDNTSNAVWNWAQKTADAGGKATFSRN